MKRHTIDKFINYSLSEEPFADVEMVEDSDGEWVRTEDAQAEAERLRDMVEWRPIDTAPVNQQIMLADMSGGNRFMFIGVIYPSTGPGRATHWLPMLPLPNTVNTRSHNPTGLDGQPY